MIVPSQGGKDFGAADAPFHHALEGVPTPEQPSPLEAAPNVFHGLQGHNVPL
jgi:hypothetical protein